MYFHANPFYRYEVSATAPDWADAEKQVQRTITKKVDFTGDGPTVSVKSSRTAIKRKPGESAEDIWNEEVGEKGDKKRSKKDKGRKEKKTK